MRILLLLTALCFVTSATPAQESETIKVALYSLGPFMTATQGEPSGLVGSPLYQKFGQIKGFKIQYHYYPFARVMNLVEHGDADVAVLIAKTPERELKYQYSADHLWISRPAIVVKKTNTLASIKNVNELKGKVIGHAISSIIPSELAGLKITWRFRGEPDYFRNALKTIALGRLDAFFVPTYSYAKYMLEQLKESGNYSLVALPLDGLALYAVYPKNADPAKVLVLNQAIHETSKLTSKQSK